MENKIVLYTSVTDNVTIDVTYLEDNFWLSQKLMAQLFDVESNTITYHLKEIFKTEELIETATTRKTRVVQQEGKRQVKRDVDVYSIDAIIAVGYRVNSKKATKFRMWATQTLKEFIVKGFVLNDEMLKNGKPFGKDYFNELLERIREIRSSERRIYQKLGDIFEQCSSDYSSKSDDAQLFFKTIQNKLHYAITGNTAAEIIYIRANATKDFMGLTSWRNSPLGKILKSDVTIAKNYLLKNELTDLNLLVSAYLDLAEFQARRGQVILMKDWIERVNKFIDSNSLEVLSGAGAISHNQAVEKAHSEFELFRIEQDKKYISDLDRVINKLKS